MLERAETIAQMPTSMVGALTGLADGRFPVRGDASYDGALDRDSALERVQSGESPARIVEDAEERDYMDIEGEPRARVISTSDGVVKRVITSKRGRRIGIVIEDSYGNRYSYYGIRRMSEGFEVPGKKEGTTRFVRLRRKAQVPGGTLLGRLGREKPMLRFGIRPAGEDSPLVDPKPMLDGWRLLEQAAVYRPSGRASFIPRTRTDASPSVRRSCCRSRCSPGASWPTPASRSIRAGAPTSSSAASTGAYWRCSPSSPRAA